MTKGVNYQPGAINQYVAGSPKLYHWSKDDQP